MPGTEEEHLMAERIPTAPAGDAESDPTGLTTDALHREVENLEELIGQRIDTVLALMRENEKRFDQRFDLISREREQNFDRLKDEIMERVQARNELDDEKFGALKEKLEGPERERVEHMKDHETERNVAKETAQRLEREVEQTAMRLERTVEETAVRLEKGVETALKAVEETAHIHSEAHAREHLSHEKIHTVENEQVLKAAQQQKEKEDKSERSLDDYKKSTNEWSKTVGNLTGNFMQRTEIETKVGGVEKDVRTNNDAIRELRETVIQQFAQSIGKTEGLSQTGRVVVGAVSLVVSALAIVGFILAFNG